MKFNSSTSNLSVLEAGHEHPRDESLALAEVALLGVLFALAALLNAGLLATLWRRRKHASRMRLFVCHLCVADLVVAFFQVCPQLLWDVTDRFAGPDPVCRLVKYLQVVGMFASTYMIVAMTVDRYQAICQPMVALQRGRAPGKVRVCAAWLVALLGAVPQLFIFSRVQVAPGVFDCWAQFVEPWGLRTYVTWTTLVIFVLPILTVITCQVRICSAVHTNLYGKTHRELEGARASSVTAVSRARIKAVKMTVVIVLVYIICWAPFFTVQLWSAWDLGAPTETATFTILMLLASLNSCANPCIYLFFSGQRPKKLLHPLCRGVCGDKDSMLEEGTVVSSFYKSLAECK